MSNALSFPVIPQHLPVSLLTPLLPAGPRVRGAGGAVQRAAQQAGQRIASSESEPLALQPHQLHHYLLWPKVWGKVIPGGQKGMRQTCPYLAVTITMLSCSVDFSVEIFSQIHSQDSKIKKILSIY